MAIQYASGSRIYTTFSGVVKNDIMTNMYSLLPTAGWTVSSGITPSVVTFTTGTPGLVNLTAHGLAAGTVVVFVTTGSLPTGISVSTVYYVVSPTANSFSVATTKGGSAITFSGTPSGTATMNSEVVFNTGVTPQGYEINCRMRDNGGSCVQFSIETIDGYLVGTNSTTYGGSVRPATGKTWIVVANQFQFLLWVQGDYNVGAEFLLVSCPYVPSFLTPKYIGVMQSAARGDGTGCSGCSGNWRYNLYGNNGDNAQNWYQAFYHQMMIDSPTSPGSGNTPGELGMPNQLYAPSPGNSNYTYRYANGDLVTLDTYLYWGLPSISNEPMMRCQLWDSIIICDQTQGDTTTTFDSHNWICVTSSLTSNTYGSLWVATP
jgi:hypothetical protein